MPKNKANWQTAYPFRLSVTWSTNECQPGLQSVCISKELPAPNHQSPCFLHFAHRTSPSLPTSLQLPFSSEIYVTGFPLISSLQVWFSVSSFVQQCWTQHSMLEVSTSVSVLFLAGSVHLALHRTCDNKQATVTAEDGTHGSFVKHFDLVQLHNLLLHQSVIQRPKGQVLPLPKHYQVNVTAKKENQVKHMKSPHQVMPMCQTRLKRRKKRTTKFWSCANYRTRSCCS